MDVFEQGNDSSQQGFLPLAERMRPRSLEDIKGQAHILAPGSILEQAIAHDRVFSMILWGPPGCGKTTLAGVIAEKTQSLFVRISAVLSGVKEVRAIIDQAKEQRKIYGKRTLLFVDEIHRFNKAQQDAFLHHVETGLITLVGATTENPSFEVNPALVSRCRVFVLELLKKEDIIEILKRAVEDTENGLGLSPDAFSPDALEHIAGVSRGDARIALTNLETAASFFRDKQGQITIEDVETAVEKAVLRYDKAGDEHYHLISAFIKSMRGSDPDAAMYWMERMLAAGEDPMYLLRRMIRFATEDVGMADPGALTMTLNASKSFRMLGRPEGDGSLYQAAVYLATAPKSNKVYLAQKQMRKLVKETGYLPVPIHIRNAHTKLLGKLGYGKDYQYPHDFPHAFVAQTYLPKELEGQRFYFPSDRGYEAAVQQRMDVWNKVREQKKNGK